MVELNKDEAFLLEWLSKEEDSAHGECRGRALRVLLNSGLAKIIPTTRGGDFDRVALTESGRTMADLLRGVPTRGTNGGEHDNR